MRRVIIGTPAYDWKVDVRYVDSLVRTIALCHERGILVMPLWQPGDALVQRARNELMRLAVGAGADDLIFIDADQFWEPEWVLALLAHPVDVVGAPVRKKTDAFEDYNVKSSGGDIQIDAATGLWMPESVGTGFLRLSSAALSFLWEISDPYTNADGSIARMVFEVGVRDDKFWSEDTMLCRKLRTAGVVVYLDSSFVVPHIGEKVYTGDFRGFCARLAAAHDWRAATVDKPLTAPRVSNNGDVGAEAAAQRAALTAPPPLTPVMPCSPVGDVLLNAEKQAERFKCGICGATWEGEPPNTPEQCPACGANRVTPPVVRPNTPEEVLAALREHYPDVVRTDEKVAVAKPAFEHAHRRAR